MVVLCKIVWIRVPYKQTAVCYDGGLEDIPESQVGLEYQLALTGSRGELGEQ
jgi:hypothetical protein